MDLETLIWIAILVVPALLQLLGRRKKPAEPAPETPAPPPLPTRREREPWEMEDEWLAPSPSFAREERFEHRTETFQRPAETVAVRRKPAPAPPPQTTPRERIARLPFLQQMVVWREILGPPRSKTGPRPPAAT